ncbi:MAG: orotidine-5'-phosphate decarboxylase [Ruminococcaceae bacterium]|nr:orotidine-5'-phosphate decarboxylase [Oscillospiraceae bacterium]
MGKDVIIACDFKGKDETLRFLERFGSFRPYVKIGMELFYAAGPDIVLCLKERGHKVFLDLKLHDIPNTVKKAMTVLAGLGADMLNVHASGTIAMMEAARDGVLAAGGISPLLIAVTQLTSTSEERMQNELLISASLDETVIKYAKNTKTAGLDGVVCSPLESGLIHSACGNDFLTVTPGIRFSGGAASDQVRITTPADAKSRGSDFIVVGRPITEAPDPVLAWEICVSDFV